MSALFQIEVKKLQCNKLCKSFAVIHPFQSSDCAMDEHIVAPALHSYIISIVIVATCECLLMYECHSSVSARTLHSVICFRRL